MSKIRLTNQLRKRFTCKIVDAAFAKRKAASLVIEQLLFEACLDHILGKADRAAIAKAPQHWFDHVNSLTVNAGGYQLQINSEKAVRVPHWDTNKNPFSHRYFNVTDHELIKRLQEWANINKTTADETRTFEKEVRAILNSVATVEAFFDIFPDANTIVGDVSHLRKHVTALAIPPEQTMRKMKELMG